MERKNKLNNLHISLTEFRNESRVLKETNSILNHNIASKVYIASLHSDRLEEEKIYNDNLISTTQERKLNITNDYIHKLSKCLIDAWIKR